MPLSFYYYGFLIQVGFKSLILRNMMVYARNKERAVLGCIRLWEIDLSFDVFL